MFKKKKNNEFVSIIIVASGNSTRFGENKLLVDILGQSVIERTISAFSCHEKVSEIILVCRQEDILEFSNICSSQDFNIKIVSGGNTRTHSTLNGLNACSKDAQIIGIHDGARPLILAETITNTINSAILNKACIPVVAVKDTIKSVRNDVCFANHNRNDLFLVQTPQVFDSEIILNATKLAVAKELDFTDNSTCVEYFGTKVHTVLGSYDNLKITTKEDILLAQMHIESRGF